jgi:FkbM family methyltransferase
MTRDRQPSGDERFQHYHWQDRVIAWISQNLFDGVVYTVRHGLLAGMKRKGGLGWVPRRGAASEETPETRFWRTLDLSGRTVYDVGAYHGLLTLFFSRSARRVVSYEPNNMNHSRLVENLKLNGVENVTVRRLGLGALAQTAAMTYSPLMSGGASLAQGDARQHRRFGGVKTEQIEITTLDQDIEEQHLPPPDLIKIDVEGWELEVLKGARRTLTTARPALLLEMHGDTMNEKMRKVAALVEFLIDAGYRHIRHVETGVAVTRTNSAIAAQGHLHCRSGADGVDVAPDETPL